MNSFKSPRRKLNCILKCCQIIYSIISTSKSISTSTNSSNSSQLSSNSSTQLSSSSSSTSNSSPTPIGADEFLPLLIYVIIRSNPPALISNIEYISRFRNSSLMIAESSYYFLVFYSAVTFIEQLDSSSLSLSPDEYQRYIFLLLF